MEQPRGGSAENRGRVLLSELVEELLNDFAAVRVGALTMRVVRTPQQRLDSGAGQISQSGRIPLECP